MTNGGLCVNGYHYGLEISGSGEGLLLLHGFGGDKTMWADLRARLDSEYRVIAADILGHGTSDKPSQVPAYHMERVSRDILSLLDELRIPECHMLGYSMGGRLALHLAACYPGRFRSLILESASPGLADDCERAQRRRQDEALAGRIETMGIAWFADYWEKLPLWKSQVKLSEDILSAQRKQRLGNSATGLANSLRGMGSGAQPNLWPRLGQVMMPTLLLVGEGDSKFVAINQLMARQIPRTDLRVIPDAGHNIHLEQPLVFQEQVNSFLQGR
ncbi:MAG: 2-succinyl-6-hydroxy-2,4-cyclohexadiene-1-carboxylate synthase [Chloroflexi bacterium]|nr:2-succinyl-6-hydroxy-2,4-cyclohexadiene-1-carboxylate synthase [Chloroflexota bacterium]